MVVIKEAASSLSLVYGPDFVSRLTDFSSVIGYTVEADESEIKVEFNPDRPDLFSFTTLSFAMGQYEGTKKWNRLKFTGTKADFNVDPKVRNLRPLVMGFHCHGPKLGNSFRDLIDFQERIHLSVGKDRKKVSIGIHDTSRVRFPLVYKAMDLDQVRFTTYDGEVTGTARKILKKHPKGIEYAPLIPDTGMVPIIEDSNHKVLSMPPVVNGNISTVSEDSKDLFIDITGTDRNSMADAFFLLAYFFQELEYELGAPNLEDFDGILDEDGRIMKVNIVEMAEIIGADIDAGEISKLLLKMGYYAELAGDTITVHIPGNRIDVMGPADIIEDIAKAYGYDNISPRKPEMNIVGSESPMKPFLSNFRYLLIGLGYQETMAYVVTSERYYGRVNYTGGLRIQNPKSRDFSVVRDRLYLGILGFLSINRRRPLPQKIFEIGAVIIRGVQHTSICVALENSRAGFSDIKKVLDSTIARLGLPTAVIKPRNLESMINGRAGAISILDQEVGIIGEVNPETLDDFELKNPVSLFEMDLGALFDLSDKNSR